jgi:hypothetical protein
MMIPHLAQQQRGKKGKEVKLSKKIQNDVQL